MPPGFVPNVDAALASNGVEQGGLARSILAYEKDYGLAKRQFWRIFDGGHAKGVELPAGKTLTVDFDLIDVHRAPPDTRFLAKSS